MTFAELADVFPDPDRMSKVFEQAAAPAFFLGACAALVALLMTRLSDVMHQLRTRGPHKHDDKGEFLLRRARLLHSAIRLSLAAGICTAVLLVVAFGGAFLRVQHIFGAGFLFLSATVLIGLALFRFAQEVRVGVDELDDYL